MDISLHFVKNYGSYYAGTIATFPASAAKVIVDAGAATIIKAAEAAPERKSKIVKK